MDISQQKLSPQQWLEELASAIADEADAMVAADAESLMKAVARKESAARVLETLPPDVAAGLDPMEVVALREANLSNGALMTAAQAHASWTLEKLGRMESSATYTGHGQVQPQAVPRYYGSA